MLIIFLQLFECGYFGDKEIEDCVKEVNTKKRPTVDPTYCLDANPETCAALFKKEDANYAKNLDP